MGRLAAQLDSLHSRLESVETALTGGRWAEQEEVAARAEQLHTALQANDDLQTWSAAVQSWVFGL